MSSGEQPRECLRIGPDDTFCRRILSREEEDATAAPSFWVYVAPAAVPFLWESRPGTPKDTAVVAAPKLSPLAPPPSHRCRRDGAPSSAVPRPAGILPSLLPDRLRPRKKAPPLAPASPSAPSSSNLPLNHYLRSCDDNPGDGSPTSILCFSRSRRLRC